MALPEYPTFSWSSSRERTLDECNRRYHHQYYGSWSGWAPDAPESARATYAAKQLTSVPEMIGQVVHQRALELAGAIRDEQPWPAVEEVIQRSRDAMNRVNAASADRAAFLRSPKHHPMFTERYLDLLLSSEKLARYAARLRECVTNLYDWPGWADVAACGRRDILTFSSMAAVEFEGHPLYAAPDLVYRLPNSEWTVVDYKTSRALTDPDRAQIAVYYLYLILSGVIARDDVIYGRLVNLVAPENEVFRLTARDLEAAERRIRESTWKMRGLLVEMDATRNVALPIEHFPLTPVRERCRWCKFQAICGAEIEAAETCGPF
jgi:CRISPR/Cas system-associated exonuclease Cas4 (RecB family)